MGVAPSFREANVSHYDSIKANYLKRRRHETDCVAAAKLFLSKLGHGFGWPDEQRHIGPLPQTGAGEHVVDGHFVFDQQGKLRGTAQFGIDGDSPPVNIPFHLEKAPSGSWQIGAAGVQLTFDLYSLRLVPDKLSHAILAVIKSHFEPTYQIPS